MMYKLLLLSGVAVLLRACLIVTTVVLLVLGFILFPITYHVDIGNIDFDNTEQLDFAKTVLRFADSNDTVVLHINSVGGYTYLGNAVANAVLVSDAYTVSINEGSALSYGAIIALSAKEVRALPISFFMFHRPAYSIGDMRSLVGEDNPTYRLLQRFMEEKVFPLLTESEKEVYNSGDDLVLLGDELLERIQGTGETP